MALSSECLFGLGEINDAAKANGCAAVECGPAQQKLGGEICGLGPAIGVPAGAFRLIKRTASDDAEPGAGIGSRQAGHWIGSDGAGTKGLTSNGTDANIPSSVTIVTDGELILFLYLFIQMGLDQACCPFF